MTYLTDGYKFGGIIPGELFWYAGTTVPDGSLECTGQEVSQTTYAQLYENIGTLWNSTGGAGAPAGGNFRLPPSVVNSTNVFISAKGTSDTVGDALTGQNKSHGHSGSTSSDNSHRHSVGYSNQVGRTDSDQNRPVISGTGTVTYWTTMNGAHTHTMNTVSNSGSSKARPQAAVFKLCIWTEPQPLSVSRVGVIFDWAGSSAPDGALVCDGSEVSQTTYADLYTAIGTQWNTTNGAGSPAGGNFRLPPSANGGIGIFMRPSGLESVGVGTAHQNLQHNHTSSTQSNGSHNHTFNWTYHNDTDAINHQTTRYSGGSAHYGSYAGTHSHTVTLANDTTGKEARPDSIVALRCIWYK